MPEGPHTETPWSGPGTRQVWRAFTWSGLLWSMIYPQRGQRILPTLPGVVLIGLSFAVGTAAYNSSSNILFITLSLLLACLILSGVLSSMNLRGVRWRLQLAPPLRAGHEAVAALELRNRKRFLPTYGLWFDFAARSVDPIAGQRAEMTLSARSADIRAALAKADLAENRGQVALIGRLDPGGESRVEWVFKPARRGRLRLELVSVGSLFPFGFLRKDIGTELIRETIVWPAPVEYRRHPVATLRRSAGGQRMARAGSGGDLLALRRYATGDSHRLIHWKASARTGNLLVRQFAAESAEGYSLWLRTDAGVWTQAEQFELLISFVATLVEDLFRAGRLLQFALDAAPPVVMRRVHDLELVLDQLALARPVGTVLAVSEGPATKQSLMTFAPEGTRGVAAFVDGQKAASA
ncbi:DUF58 domain-containing protein [Horticoccus sp. 23ND18S-11]|uniref:DUF58 domain-containing protein n=1 Tax=Horticoccus sp. 23ND18S-11 TaxID=3391832 RepID=UPI0039C9AC32